MVVRAAIVEVAMMVWWAIWETGIVRTYKGNFTVMLTLYNTY